MESFQDIAKLSALPIVNLNDITVPIDGYLLATTDTCHRNFRKSDACRQHYEKLSHLNKLDSNPIQCPFGFSTFVFDLSGIRCGVTGVVPFPRLGGDKERIVAKKHPDVKYSRGDIRKIIGLLLKLYDQLNLLRDGIIKSQSVALHEIRKMNRTVKQTAERLYSHSQQNLSIDKEKLLLIWKTADLMSGQFEIIELLANEGLANLPLNSTANIYQIFDKVVHIYQPDKARIKLVAPSDYQPMMVRVNDKTFPIIPTVLIENALRYSKPESDINVAIETEHGDCVVKVISVPKSDKKLDNSIFQKGVRGSSEGEGSGNGLYVAQLVAKQHRSEIKCQHIVDGKDSFRCVFSIRLPLKV